MKNILRHIAILLQLLALAPVNTLIAFGVTGHAANDCCTPQPTELATATTHQDVLNCCSELNEADSHDPASVYVGIDCSTPDCDEGECHTQHHPASAHHCTCCFAGTIVQRDLLTPPIPMIATPISYYLPHPLSAFPPVIDHPPCLL